MENEIEMNIAKKPMSKDLIEHTFIMLANHYNIAKISIDRICKTCGISRTCFYYHFENKEALIEYIQYKTVNHLSEEMIGGSLSFSQSLIKGLQAIAEKKTYYIQLYKYAGNIYARNTQHPNKFHLIMHEVMLRQLLDLCKTRRIELSQTVSRQLSFFAHGLISSIEFWLLEQSNEKPEDLAETIMACVPQALKEILY